MDQRQGRLSPMLKARDYNKRQVVNKLIAFPAAIPSPLESIKVGSIHSIRGNDRAK